MIDKRRVLTIAAIAAIAIAAYVGRIRHEMIDFLTWRQSVIRALNAEPLYRAEDGHYQFKYFPAYGLLMAPFGIVGEETGKAIWFAVLVVLLSTFVLWSITALPKRRLRQNVLAWITLLLMAKFYVHELLLGQVNLLLGMLLVGALLAVQSNRRLVAGALVGAAVFVKPYALILMPWLLVATGWPAVAAAATAVVLGLLLPAAVYGWEGNLDLLRAWLRTVTDSTAPNLLGNDNVSIAAMWAKWIGPGDSASTLAWLTTAGALSLAILAWAKRRTVTAPEYLECALLMLLIPLISPQGWDYVLLLATPAVVCLVDRWREFTPPVRWVLAGALAVMGFTFFDIMGRTLYGRFMSLSLITVCALIIAGGLVHARWRGLA